MAATRLIALHINKGKSVAQCLRDRTDYAQNPEKTEKGELVTAYECDPMTADQEFLLAKRQYEHITGRRHKRDVIAYQIRQSFKPGEVTPEEANAIGQELAKRFTRVYLRSQKCWDIRQKAPDARRMSAALLGGMQANATRQMGLFGRIEQRWGIFRYTLRKYKGRTSYRALRLLTVVCHR